jgi:hypothetical protein
MLSDVLVTLGNGLRVRETIPSIVARAVVWEEPRFLVGAALSSKLTRRDLLASATTAMALIGCAKARTASCTDTRGLTADEAQWRKSKGYVEPTTEPGKACAACAYFLAPQGPQTCGSCKVLKGPVHPMGSCFDFVALASQVVLSR